jgi:trans-aconitate 2-methyltransferase
VLGQVDVTDTWDPATYERFKDERRQPFDDLLRMVEPCPSGRVVDLGCGTGSLTAELHEHCQAAETVGIDGSASMLDAAPSGVPGLRFEVGDISTYDQGDLDVVFSNAALHWVPDHETLIPRLVGLLGTYGQIAFQVPANFDHPSHLLAQALAAEEPYLSAFGGSPPASRGDTVLGPERYAQMLDGLGAVEMSARLQVYNHHLPSTAAVVDWVRGTLLTPFQAALGEELFARFVAEYRRRLVAELGDDQPYFYAFKRILVWARLP